MAATYDVKAVIEVVDHATNIVAKILGSITDLGRAVSDVAGDVIKKSTSMAGEFDEKIRIMEIAARSSGESFDVLRDAAIKVGGDTRLLGVSAVGAADSLTSLYKSGLTTAQIMGDMNGYMEEGAELGGLLRASIDLASASTLDMAGAADFSIEIMSAYKNALEEGADVTQFAADSMDLIVRAADASTAEVEDLTWALRYSAPAAAQSGISIGELTTGLAMLADMGIKGSAAGTQLRNIILSLKNPTKKAAGMMDELRVSMYDLDTGAARPLQDVLIDLKTATEGMTDAQRDNALGSLVSKANLGALMSLVEGSDDGWNTMTTNIANAAGVQEYAAVKAASLGGLLEALEGTIETLSIQLGDVFLPYAISFAEWAGEMATTYGPGLILIVQGIVDAVGPLVGAFMEFGTRIAEGHDPMTALKLALKDLLPPGLAGRVFVIMDSVARLGDKVGKFLTPILDNLRRFLDGTFAIAVADAGALFDDFFSRVSSGQDPISAIRDMLWEMIPPDVQALLLALGEAAMTLGGYLTDLLLPPLTFLGELLAGELVGSFTTLQEAFGLFMGFITEGQGPLEAIGSTFMEMLPPDVVEKVERFVEIFDSFSSFVVETLLPTLDDLAVFFQEGLPEALGELGALWDEVFPVMRDAIIAFGIVVVPILAAIGSLFLLVFGDIYEWVVQNWPEISEIIGTKLEQIFGIFEFVMGGISLLVAAVMPFIVAIIRGAMALILTIIEVALHLINGDWGKAFRALWRFVVQIWDIIWKAIHDSLDGIARIFGTSLEEIGETWSSNWEAFKEIVGLIWEKIKIMALKWWLKFSDTWSKNFKMLRKILAIFSARAVSSWNEFWAEFFNKASNWVERVKLKISTTFLKAKAKIKEIWTDVGEWLETAFNNIVTFVTEVGGDIVSGVVTWCEDAVVAVEGFASNMLEAGGQMMQGLIDGIVNAGSGVIDAVVGAATDAIAAAKRALGIHSPSKVFETIGRFLMVGFISGVVEEAKAMEGTMTDIAMMLMDSFLGMANEVGSIGGAFAQMFQAKTVDPLAEAVDASTSKIAELDEAIAGMSSIEDAYGAKQTSVADELEAAERARMVLLDKQYKQTRVIRDLEVERSRYLGGSDGFLSTSQQIEAAQAEMQGINSQIAELQKSKEILAASEGTELAKILGEYGSYVELQNAMAGVSSERSKEMEKQLELAKRLAEEEEKIRRIEEQREEIEFLNQQMALLKLIEENNLDAGKLLEGMTLGVNADLGQLLDITGQALETIVEETEKQFAHRNREYNPILLPPVDPNASDDFTARTPTNTTIFNLNYSATEDEQGRLSASEALRDMELASRIK